MSVEEINILKEKARENESTMKWKKAANNWLKASNLCDGDKAKEYRLNACEAIFKVEGTKDFFKNVEIVEKTITSIGDDKKTGAEYASKLAEYISGKIDLITPKEGDPDLAIIYEKLGNSLIIAGDSSGAMKALSEAGNIYDYIANYNLSLKKKKNDKKAAEYLTKSHENFIRTEEKKKASLTLKKLQGSILGYAGEGQGETTVYFIDHYTQLAGEKDVFMLLLEVVELLRKNNCLKEDLELSERAGISGSKLGDVISLEKLAEKLFSEVNVLYESNKGSAFDYLVLAGQIYEKAGKKHHVAVFSGVHAKKYYTGASGIFAGQDRERAWKLYQVSINLFNDEKDFKSAGMLEYEMGVLTADKSDYSRAEKLFISANDNLSKENLTAERLLVVDTIKEHLPDLITNKKVDSLPFSKLCEDILVELKETEKLGDIYALMAGARFDAKEYDYHLDLIEKSAKNYMEAKSKKNLNILTSMENRIEILAKNNPDDCLKLLDLHSRIKGTLKDVKSAVSIRMNAASSLIGFKYYDHSIKATDGAYDLSKDAVNTLWVTAKNFFDVRNYKTSLEQYTRTMEILAGNKDVNSSRKLAKELEISATREEKNLVKKDPELKQAFIDLALSVYETLSLVGEKGDLFMAEAKRYFEREEFMQSLQRFENAASVYMDRNRSAAAEVAELIQLNAQRLLDRKKYDISQSFFDSSARTFRNLNDHVSEAKTFATQAISLLSMKKFDDGLEALEKSTKTFIDDNKHLKAGEVYQHAAQTMISIGQEVKALELFNKAFTAFNEINDRKKVVSLGQSLENYMNTISTSKKRRELYETYFNTVESYYEKSNLKEQLGDLYVTKTKRALDFKEGREIITEYSQQASSHYGVEYSHKIDPMVNILIEYSHKYLEEQEYVKAADITEQAAEMLLEADKDEEAAELSANESFYLIKNGAVDTGIGVLEKSAAIYESLNMSIKTGEILFEGAKVLAKRDMFATSIANIARAVSIFEDLNELERIKEIANQCVVIAENLTNKHNDTAAKLYIDQSTEFYGLPGISVDTQSEVIYGGFTDTLLDSMQKTVTHHSKKRKRRKRKRKKKVDEE